MASLAAADDKAYRSACAGMLDRFAKTTDPAVARRVVVNCVAAPKAVPNPNRLITLAELACATDRVSHLGVLGAAYYRAGQTAHALNCFTEKPRSPPRAWDWLFEAMTHQGLGERAAARECVSRAEKWLAIVGPPGPDDQTKPIPRWYNWQDEVAARFLHREAQEMLEKDSKVRESEKQRE